MRRRAFALCGLLVISWETTTNGLRNSNSSNLEDQRHGSYHYKSHNNNYNSNNNNNNNNYNLRPQTKGSNRRNYKYLSACIGPFRSYIAKDSGYYRVPSGQVFVIFDGGRAGKFEQLTGGNYPGLDPKLEFTVQYDLTGLPDDCRHCKISIHQGKTCDAPLTRYWKDHIPRAYNPWKPRYGASYSSDHLGKAKGHFSMFDGYNFDDHKQRTMVVFGKDGITKIGCGVLRKGEHGLCLEASTGGGPPTNQPQAPFTESPAPISKPVQKPTGTTSPTPFSPQPIMETSAAPSLQGTVTESPTLRPIARPTRPPRPPVLPPSMAPPSWVTKPTKGPRPTKPKSVMPPNSPKGAKVVMQPRVYSPPPGKKKSTKKSSKKDGGPKGKKSDGPGPKF